MRGLPAGWYRDPVNASFEFERIFRRSWQFVGHAADLPAVGTAARLDCGDLSLFVLRGADGALRAFRNACSHRGSRLIDGDPSTGLAFVLDARVRCSYHGWCFDSQGRLESLPGDPGLTTVDANAHALAALPIAEWRGLVFASLGEPAADIVAALDDVAPAWPDATPLRRLCEPRVLDVPADWKLACEHLLDPTHHEVVRSTPVAESFAPDAVAGANASAVRLQGRSLDTARPAWPARSYLALAQRLGLPLTAEFLFAWPNVLLVRAPGVLTVVQVLPVRPGASRIRAWRYGDPDARRDAKAMRYVQERAWRRGLDDARRRLERLQHGLLNFEASRECWLGAGQPGLKWFAERRRDVATPAPSKPRARRTRKASPVVAE